MAHTQNKIKYGAVDNVGEKSFDFNSEPLLLAFKTSINSLSCCSIKNEIKEPIPN
jgi:hypothetical protein